MILLLIFTIFIVGFSCTLQLPKHPTLNKCLHLLAYLLTYLQTVVLCAKNIHISLPQTRRHAPILVRVGSVYCSKKNPNHKKLGSTVLRGLPNTTYSQALSHYCLARELLPAAFPPWAGTFLIIEPGTTRIPPCRPC